MVKVNINPSMVFPTTKLEAVNKLITEGNLTRLINNLLDTDSYLLPLPDLSFDEENIIQDADAGTLVAVPDTAALAELEFVLHGYYFNLGTIASLSTSFTGSANKKLSVRIIVDTTDADYPELFGEEAEISSPVHLLTGQTIIPGETILDANFMNKNIKSIYAFDTNNTKYVFTLNADWQLVLSNSSELEELPTFEDGYFITYVTYYNTIQCYVTDIDENPADTSETSPLVLPSSYEDYMLDVLYRVNGELYLPLKNFLKFTSRSIASIDGGII